MQFTQFTVRKRSWACALVFILLSFMLAQAKAQAAPAVKLIPLGQELAGIAVNSRTNQIYVAANFGGVDYGILDFINGNTNKVTGSVEFSGFGTTALGNNVSVDETRNRIYVAGDAAGTPVIDGKTHMLLVNPAFDTFEGEGLTLNPVTNRIYDLYPDDVAVIDGTTYRTIANIQNVSPDPLVTGGAKGIAVNPVTNKIYVVDGERVVVIDGQTNRIVANIEGNVPTNVAVNAATNKVYATQGNDGKTMEVIDGRTNTIIATVPFTDYVGSLAVNPITNRIYVLEPHQLEVVNGSTNRIIESVPLSDLNTRYVAVNPVTGLVYVTALSGSTYPHPGVVAVIDDSAAQPAPPDKTPPQVAITTPANGATVSSLQTISGRAVDNAGGTGISSVTVFLRRVSDGAYWNGSKWVTQPVGLNATLNGDTWTITDNFLPAAEFAAGRYRVLAVAYDGRNNRADASSSFEIDKTAPQVSFTFPKAGATLTNLSYVAGRIVDNTTAADKVLLYLRRLSDGSYWTGNAWSQQPVALTTSVAGNVWARRGGLPNASQLGSDSYRLIALATDPADNHGSATIAITTRNGG